MYGILIFIFVLICIMLMGIILLQSSKSGGMGSAMGGQAINSAFGGYGADKLLVKITSGLAVAFMTLAIIIGMMDNPSSRLDYDKEPTMIRNKSDFNKQDVNIPAPTIIEPVENSSDIKLDIGNTKTDNR